MTTWSHPKSLTLKQPMKDVSDREAMGYPDSFVPSVSENLEQEYNCLRKSSKEELLNMIENPLVPLSHRYIAGQLLALIHDPRIKATAPPMIRIPAAKVEIGLRKSEFNLVTKQLKPLCVDPSWIEKETPSYAIQIKNFCIAKYPVTNCEYRQFLIETLHPELPTSWKFGQYPKDRANHPVYSVSVSAIEAYLAWLQQKTKLPYRLPTEAEWEYAASGGDRREYPWGNFYEPHRANTVEEGFLGTTPVGIFVDGNSPFGISDMAGNVEEYVSDAFKPYPGANLKDDDLVETLGTYRVARGGSFTRFYDLVRCKRRHGKYPKDIYVMGFRLALSGHPKTNKSARTQTARKGSYHVH